MATKTRRGRGSPKKRPPSRARPGAGSPQSRRAQRAAEQRRRQTRRRVARAAAAVAAAVVVIVAAVIVFGGGGGRDEASQDGVEGLRTFEVASADHVSGDVSYPQTPPVGGDHAPVWQNCGFYEQPILPTLGVHSMEHGGVWVTYSPDLPADQIGRLRQLAEGQTYVLASPWFERLPFPVVASAWGRQLGLPSASDPRLEQFLQAFRQGPQAPEPGAPCTGGQG